MGTLRSLCNVKKPVNGRPGGVASAGPPGKDGRGERNPLTDRDEDRKKAKKRGKREGKKEEKKRITTGYSSTIKPLIYISRILQ